MNSCGYLYNKSAGIKIMKFSVKKFYLLLISFIPVLMLCIPNTFGAPSMKLDDFSYTAGDIIEGEELTHEFKISNTGDKTLIIEKIDAG